MWKHASILILAVAIGAAFLIRIASIVHPRVSRFAQLHSDPVKPDVGTAMRRITGRSPRNAKTWVLDEVAFRNSHSDRPWIIARCDRPATSGFEAIESAHDEAARQIFPIVRSRVHAWPADGKWLETRIEAAAHSGRFDSDACVERFDRPYGSVYCGSVLIDASADRIEPIIRDAQMGLNARHRHAGIRLTIAVVVLIFVWLAYVLSNSVTRGYVTGRLRLIAVAITVGIVLLV